MEHDDVLDPFTDVAWEKPDPNLLWEVFDDIRPAEKVVYGVIGDEVVFIDHRIVEAMTEALDTYGFEPDVDDVPWVESYQDQWLPTAVVERFGSYDVSMLDGECVAFRAADVDAIVGELTARGIHCRCDDETVARCTDRD